MRSAESFALRAELERLAHHHAALATHARRVQDFGEAWTATDDHVHVFDDGSGRGIRVAVKTRLIDPEHVAFVPEEKRVRITPEVLASVWEELKRKTRELLDGELIGEGDLVQSYDTLADAIDLARARIEGATPLA